MAAFHAAGRSWLTRLALVAVLMLGLAQGAQAQKLEIVFRDGLWGAAIGALVGTAQLAFFKENPEKEVPRRIVQATAIGALVGVVYGVLDANGLIKVGALDADGIDKGSPLALYEPGRNRLTLGPPAVRFSQNERGGTVAADLFQMRF
jgi:hypothetical protein